MMRETLRIGTAQRAQLPGWMAAGKTGTSQDFRDAWFVGYTAHLVTGVWLGNDDSSPTKKATGGGLPVDIWSRVMRAGHQGIPPASLPGLEVPAIASISSLFGGKGVPTPPAAIGAAPSGAPTPPAAIGAAPTGPPQASNGGLDGWFLDRVFGRR
jgi:penicillin-binding protein 1A